MYKTLLTALCLNQFAAVTAFGIIKFINWRKVKKYGDTAITENADIFLYISIFAGLAVAILTVSRP